MQAMKTIGLIGGLSWKATISYYDYLNMHGNRYLGKAHSPHILIDSLDFEYVAQLLSKADDRSFVNYLSKSANRLIDIGADMVVICCNSAHKVATELMGQLCKPLIDIRYALVEKLLEMQIDCVGLLGTCFTMEQHFYHDVLEKSAIRCLIPEVSDRQYINEVIMRKLSIGVVEKEFKQKFVEIGSVLAERGAKAIVLACTELPLLLGQSDFDIPVVDTILVHAENVFQYAISKGGCL
jgi:aspartate racemase